MVVASARPRLGVLEGIGTRVAVDAARALELIGVAVQRAPSESTTRGQWRVARAAGLVAGQE